MRIRFNDGMTFDRSGPLRLTKRRDGWYVIGEGLLCPIDSPEEGRTFIENRNQARKNNNNN